jgi:hypothetical protein
MNYAIRLVALTFMAAAFTGSTPSRVSHTVLNLPNLGVPGPTPTCNPFIHQCPTIR